MKVGKSPIVRVHGDLKPLNRPPVENEEMVKLLVPIVSERHRRIFEEEGGADFAYVVDVDGVSWRFRVNMLKQLGKIGWWLDASTTTSRTSKVCSSHHAWKNCANMTKDGAASWSDRIRGRVPRSLPC